MKNNKIVTENFTTDEYKEISKMFSLLRRTYDLIEMSHLTDGKLIPTYCKDVKFPRRLGEDIFNYLQSKDQFFRDTIIKRQKRYRRKHKNKQP